MPAITNVAVRFDDRGAWLGAIRKRELAIDGKRPLPHLKSARAAEVAGYAWSAQEALADPEPNREAAIEHLQTSIALAVGLLTELKA
ncbi:hypothetical protein [Erythrobacter sp. EC-HK427]